MVGWKVSVREMTEEMMTENVAKKINLPYFKCHRVYLELLNLSNVDDFSCSCILKDFIQFQKEKGQFVVVCSLSL